jgi:hypothetical protein
MESWTKLMPTAEETTEIEVGATFKYPPELTDSDNAQDLQV